VSRAVVVADLVREQLKRLKMPGLGRALDTLSRQADQERWSFQDFLHECRPVRVNCRVRLAEMVPTCFDVLSELFARDVDRELLKRAQARTPTERLIWLEEMQAFAEDVRHGQRMQLIQLLTRLADGGVRFALIGGVALIARGVQQSAQVVDIAYARDRENLARLAATLRPLNPRLRGVPAGLPFVLDEGSLLSGLNFTLDTDLGPLDLFGDVPGLGTFERVDAASGELEIAGARILVLTLDGLEAAKRATGQPKDLVDLGYIRALKG
jgi:hypothetical protein